VAHTGHYFNQPNQRCRCRRETPTLTSIVNDGCPIIRSPTRKVSSGRQLAGKNPSRQGGRRAGRIFTGKLSAGGDFSRGDPIIWRRFYEAGDILIRWKHQKRDYFSSGKFFMERHFNVTPASIHADSETRGA